MNADIEFKYKASIQTPLFQFNLHIFWEIFHIQSIQIELDVSDADL